MREILFRGKRKDNGTWTGGYLFCIWEKSYLCWGTTNNVPNMNEIIPETVCQFTGLTDKNGSKIFEGDIVRTKYGKICKVFWASILDYNGWGLKAVGIPTKTRPDGFDLWWSENLEVIGNIYDNPELMEVKEMKKVTLSVTLNAEDKFETGDCKTCPISLKTYEEIQRCEGIYKYSCPLGYTNITCPMEAKQNG